MTGFERFEQVTRDVAAIKVQLDHAEAAFRRGHRDRLEDRKGTLCLLAKILERHVRELPTLPGAPQPARLGGDATGGEAA